MCSRLVRRSQRQLTINGGVSMFEAVIDVVRSTHANEWAKLQADISRLQASQKLMRAANHALSQGNVGVLRSLGFSMAHIAELRTRAASGRDAFSRSSLQNNAADLRQLQSRAHELAEQG